MVPTSWRSDIEVHSLTIESKTIMHASKQLPLNGKRLLLSRQPLVHGGQHLNQRCTRRRRRSFNRLSEESTRIFWCLDSQLFLEHSKGASLFDEVQFTPQIPHEQFCSLAAHARCVVEEA